MVDSLLNLGLSSCRLEADTSDESREALRNLVLLVSSLSYCGYVELKPSSASVGSLFHIPGFTLPIPSGRGLFDTCTVNVPLHVNFSFVHVCCPDALFSLFSHSYP